MPDPERKTLSATQAPALYGASPYITPWMLWKHFADGVNIEPVQTSRMSWGKKLQPLVLDQAASDLKLAIRPNVGDVYIRRGRLGCTRDAEILCPDRGPGAFEAKCVFGYDVWMADWNGGKNPPRWYEIQLQEQMVVGNGKRSYRWGVIAAWVAGEMHYFERRLDEKFAASLSVRVSDFFEGLERRRAEPNPLGLPVEVPLLAQCFPVIKGKELDLRGRDNAADLAQLAVMYAQFTFDRNFYDRAADAVRAQLMAACADAETVTLPGDVSIKLATVAVPSRAQKGYSFKTLKVRLPQAPLAEEVDAGQGVKALIEAG